MDPIPKAPKPTYKAPTKVRHSGTSPSATPSLQPIGNPVYYGYELWELVSSVFAKLRFTNFSDPLLHGLHMEKRQCCFDTMPSVSDAAHKVIVLPPRIPLDEMTRCCSW